MAAADTRQRIFDTASILFFEKGYNNTTVSEIIEMSKTNKGSFYHHFEDKQHLAYNICTSMMIDIDSGIKALFPEIEDIDRMFLQECVFWKVFFTQTQIRQFTSEIYEISYTGTKIEFLNAILNLIPDDLTNRDMLMIQGVDYALKSRFISYVGRFAIRLREEEFVRFYMRIWLGTFGIHEDIVDAYIDKTYSLMSVLEINNRGFSIEITKTE